MLENGNSQDGRTDLDSGLMDGINYTGNKGPCFGTRYAIIIMAALGSALTAATKLTFSAVVTAMTTNGSSSNPNIPTYEWNNKGVILSSVLWLGIPTQIIAGPLVKKYGHKWFFMGSVLVNAIFYMLIPPFARFGGSTAVIICRLIEGLATGLLSPVSGTISGLWVPAEERSRAGMISSGIQVLMALVSSVASLLIAPSSVGYPGVCYIVGALNLIWCIGWYFLGHQSPSTHPRITPEEQKYIETSLNSRKTEHIPTPWRQMLTSLHFWAPVVAAIGTNWIDTIMSTVNLLYVTQAWKVDMRKSAGVFGTAPLVGIGFGILFVPISDCLIKRKHLSVVNARRVFHTVGIIGNSFVLIWMTFIPPGSMALILLNLCIGNIFTMIFSVAGASINILDIAPAFAGIISGFASTFSQCFALFAPMTRDWIIDDESNQAEWRTIFLITAAIATGTAVFFDIFATDKRKWENVDKESEESNND